MCLKGSLIVLFLIISGYSATVNITQEDYILPRSVTENFTIMRTELNNLEGYTATQTGINNEIRAKISELDSYLQKNNFKTELILIASVFFLMAGIGVNIVLTQTKLKEFMDLMKMRYDTRPISTQISEDIGQLEVNKVTTLVKPPKGDKNGRINANPSP
jgi:hypothetical protein